MVRCSLYKSNLDCVSFVLIRNIEFSVNNAKKLIDIFGAKLCLSKILALDRSDVFFKCISSEKYCITFPIEDTITSETIITSNVFDFLSIFEKLIDSEPRCVSFYEINNQDFLEIIISNCQDEYLITNGVVDYVISFVLEESCVKISFNSNYYNSKSLFQSIRKVIKSEHKRQS